MKKYIVAALLLGCGAALYAQNAVPVEKAKATAAAPKKTAQAKPVKPAAAPAPEKKAVKAEPPKQTDQDNEEAGVMIDSKGDAEENGNFSSGEDREERTVPGGIPSSYGQCKGTITEGGRSLLVFESAEDGTLYFVQIAVGKSNVTWKLVDRIGRSAD